MLIDTSCKQGRLQIFEDGTIRVVSPFLKRLIWSVPHSHVRKFAVRHGIFSCSMFFTTSHGTYQVDSIPKQYIRQLQGLFPNSEIATKQPKKHRHQRRHNKFTTINKANRTLRGINRGLRWMKKSPRARTKR